MQGPISQAHSNGTSAHPRSTYSALFAPRSKTQIRNCFSILDLALFMRVCDADSRNHHPLKRSQKLNVLLAKAGQRWLEGYLDSDGRLGALFDLRHQSGSVAGISPDVAAVDDSCAHHLVCGEATLLEKVQSPAGCGCANLRRAGSCCIQLLYNPAGLFYLMSKN